MKILIADDDALLLKSLAAMLTGWGYEVVAAPDGDAADKILQADNPPELALLDRLMPGPDGIELTRKIRQTPGRYIYILLLTAMGSAQDIVDGLRAGADDYVTKPFEADELRVRVHAGERIVRLQQALANRVSELESALERVKQLQGLLPICSYCKRIRDTENYWHQVEHYITRHSEAVFTHAYCPDCFEKHLEPQLKRIQEQKKT